MSLRTMAGVALLSLVVQSAAAQDCTVGIKPPAPGSWAEYSMEGGSMRLALLGNETRAGKSLVRVEISMTTTQGPMIMQTLVPGYPYDGGAIEDMVIKHGDQPAMRMSAQMRQMMAPRMPKDQIAEACRNAKMTRVGEESITVPAGTFKTIHYRDATSGNDVWVSETLPFGLVKTKTAQGEIVLTGQGTDARSRITETPQEMGP